MIRVGLLSFRGRFWPRSAGNASGFPEDCSTGPPVAGLIQGMHKPLLAIFAALFCAALAAPPSRASRGSFELGDFVVLHSDTDAWVRSDRSPEGVVAYRDMPEPGTDIERAVAILARCDTSSVARGSIARVLERRESGAVRLLVETGALAGTSRWFDLADVRESSPAAIDAYFGVALKPPSESDTPTRSWPQYGVEARLRTVEGSHKFRSLAGAATKTELLVWLRTRPGEPLFGGASESELLRWGRLVALDQGARVIVNEADVSSGLARVSVVDGRQAGGTYWVPSGYVL